jgi:hypothetical protein
VVLCLGDLKRTHVDFALFAGVLDSSVDERHKSDNHQNNSEGFHSSVLDFKIASGPLAHAAAEIFLARKGLRDGKD